MRTRTFVLALALLGLAVAAGSAPLPRLRPVATPGNAAAPMAAAPAPLESGPARVCGTRLESGVEAWLAHLERTDLAPLPTPNSTDTLGLAVLEDDGTFFFQDKDGHRILDLVALTQAFYRTHGDDYDFIAAWTASGLGVWLGSPGALASASFLRNDTQGIGLDPFDVGPGLGSPARLQTFLTMNSLDRYPADPAAVIPGGPFSTLDVIAHELGHRWLAYTYVDSAGSVVPALLGRDRQHWNFFMDSDSSLMEGCNWARPAPDSFYSDGVTRCFSVLDQYLMGLRPRTDVDSFFVVNDPHDFNPPGVYISGSDPRTGLGCLGRATFWRLEDIEAVNGPRLPDWFSAPHSFRIAFVLAIPRGSAASAADLAKIALFRARLVPYFDQAVQGHGAVDPTLTSQAGHVSITHEPLKDTEDASTPRPVGARVAIVQGGRRIGLDPASIRAFWRAGGAGPFVPVPLAAAGTDSFAGTLPALPGGGTAEYYLYASSDSSGIEAYDPPAGPAAPHVYVAGPDTTPPVVVHVPVRRQSLDLLPQALLARVTDNLGVDSVWVEYSVNGGPHSALACVPAGRDSFRAVLGTGLALWDRLAYRFLARDGASAHNTGTSRAGFDTLAVEHDWTLDFENGGDGFTHGAQWYSYRDAWHLTAEASSPPGGTAWKCGVDAPWPYPPHLDANLYAPEIRDLAPGTSLSFNHRFELEEANATYAWDGARLEISVNGGAWQVLAPAGGYNRVYYVNSNPFVRGTPCWSGNSGGWRTETADLSSYAPGPVRVRFRMLADDFMGFDGWLVDSVRVTWPGGALEVPRALTPLSVGRPRPNPTRGVLGLSLALPRATEAEWALYDVAGRRVATLWQGRAEAGSRELHATLPHAPAGLYFARLTLDGRQVRADRVVILE